MISFHLSLNNKSIKILRFHSNLIVFITIYLQKKSKINHSKNKIFAMEIELFIIKIF